MAVPPGWQGFEASPNSKMRHHANQTVRERDGPRPQGPLVGRPRYVRRGLLRTAQLGVALCLGSQAGLAGAGSWSRDSSAAPEYRGGLYLLPDSGGSDYWQTNDGGSYAGIGSDSPGGYGEGGSASYLSSAGGGAYSGYPGGSRYGGYAGNSGSWDYGADSGNGGYTDDSGYSGYGGGSGPGGYAGTSEYRGYSGAGGFPGSGGYSGSSVPGYGGVPGQRGPPRTGVYPTGPATLEQQYGVWGASGTQAPRWYSGGEGAPNASQYRFRNDPQLSKPPQADLPKFRPYRGQPASAFGPHASWSGLQGGSIAPAPVFRPLDQGENDRSRSPAAGDEDQGRHHGPSLGYPGPLAYPGLGLPYSGAGWGYLGVGPWGVGDGGIWPPDGIWGDRWGR